MASFCFLFPPFIYRPNTLLVGVPGMKGHLFIVLSSFFPPPLSHLSVKGHKHASEREVKGSDSSFNQLIIRMFQVK
ncbi:hypothetical protein PL586_15560 [Phocaeicola vulgatus]|nr:hypothetical protein [Phocaeicola vulgatus]